VEGNATFYATPAPTTVAAWAEQTPADFRFLFKLPRTLTHERRLRVSAAEVGAFTALLEPLGARADTIAVQLPASFGPDELPAVVAFAKAAPTTHRYAVEVRHPAFFDGSAAGDTLAAILGDAGMEWTVFDTTTLFERRPVSDAERAAWTDKPRVARRTAALTDRPVVRYIGRDDVGSTRRGWQPWLPIVVDWLLAGSTPTVFIHTPDNVDALTLARRFHADVRELVPSLEPLPTPVALDAQATLF
jgi:uncharacterized protein YecE (DUF72 family)